MGAVEGGGGRGGAVHHLTGPLHALHPLKPGRIGVVVEGPLLYKTLIAHQLEHTPNTKTIH